MRIIISPAKKMVEDPDTFLPEGLPAFLPEAERLLSALRTLTPRELKRLWACNDAIAALNVERLAHMDLRRARTPALLAYEGIQYRYLAPGVLEVGALQYVASHLRIVSGLYGLLRPFDAVTPYRLEMQARLAVDGHRDLYGFWGGRLGEALGAETDTVIDLASKEYSRAVLPHLRIRPAACEIELHPCFQQEELFRFLLQEGIQPIGYMPMGSPARPERDMVPGDVADLSLPEIRAIGEAHGVSAAAVALKWAVQRGQIPIPFSLHHYAENLRCITEDPLTEEEMNRIAALEKGNRLVKGQVFLWPGARDWHDLWDEDGSIPG